MTKYQTSKIEMAILANELYDELFPVVIRVELREEPIFHYSIPSILKNKFIAHSISRLGDLEGMTAQQFLLWEGFGRRCFEKLCAMLTSIRNGSIARLSAATSAGFPLNLAREVLEFPIDKLNIHPKIAVKIRSEVRTVCEYIRALDTGAISIAQFPQNHLEAIQREITKLSTLGYSRYLKEFSLEALDFAEIISRLENGLQSREKLILRYRLFPRVSEDFQTLEQVGAILNVSRERARQLEKGLIKRLRYRRLFQLLRVKTLASLDREAKELKFSELLANPFFRSGGSVIRGVPSAASLLSKAYASDFKLGTDAILIVDHIRSKPTLIKRHRRKHSKNSTKSRHLSY